MENQEPNRIKSRKKSMIESRAEIDYERKSSESHEHDLAERVLTDWPMFAGATKYGPMTGSTYGGGYLWRFWNRSYYWVLLWLIGGFSVVLIVVIVLLFLSGKIAF